MQELGDILNESGSTQEQANTQGDNTSNSVPPEQPAPLADQGDKEKHAAPPADNKDDPKAKGIEAALVAERRKRQQLEQQLANLTQPKPDAKKEDERPQGKPQPDQFETYEAYVEALADYQADQRWQKREQETEKKRSEEKQQQEQHEFARMAEDRIGKGRAKYADFDAVINEGLAPFLTPVMHRALVEADGGHDVAHYLGSNPAEAMRISSLSPNAQLREIFRLEERLETSSKQPPKPNLPQTLTQQRDVRGQYAQRAPEGPTSLDDILKRPK